MAMEKDASIFVAGHRGLVGSSIVRALKARGFSNLLLRTRDELDLSDQKAVHDFFARERPAYVFFCSSKSRWYFL